VFCLTLNCSVVTLQNTTAGESVEESVQALEKREEELAKELAFVQNNVSFLV